MTLKELAIGNSGVVAKISTVGPLKQRLLDMGITKGTRVKVMKIAPLGDPIEIEIRGYNLSVRKSDAETIDIDESTIVVEVIDTTNEPKEKKSWFKKKGDK